ncbi:MAG: alkaline shock response membrane anchor protein AmaP [Planctomycetota bacterium]|nr:alkaline shock response membrane anchor protein AmaP [Planctomycetota bacterium]
MRKTMDLVNLFLGIVAGFFFLAMALRTEPLLLYLQRGSQGWWGMLFLALGLAIVAANAWVVLAEYRRGHFRRNLEIVTEEGANAVSIQALEEYLLQELRRAADVIEPEVRMEARGVGEPLLCRLEFKLRRQENVMRRADELKRKVREAFAALIPTGASLEIAAHIRDLVAEGEIEKAREAEFSGPRYPVGDSEGGAA